MTAVQARRMHWTVAGVDAIIAPALLQAERTLRGVLGASRSAPSGLMVDSLLHIPDVRALEASRRRSGSNLGIDGYEILDCLRYLVSCFFIKG